MTMTTETQPQSQKTGAEQIWDEIRGLQLDMFGLPFQTVEMYLTFTPVDPSRCFMTSRASAVLPSLEAALGIHPAHPTDGRYLVEQQGNFIIVARGPAYKAV
jgi:hypothetical protein